MKKLFLYIFLILTWCNTTFAGLQIFTISCEGEIKLTKSTGENTVLDYYEDLEIFVGADKNNKISVSTIKISTSHPMFRSSTYIPEKNNNQEITGFGDIIIFDVKQSILIMKYANGGSEDGNFKLKGSKFRLSLINNTLNGSMEMLENNNGKIIVWTGDVKSKCVGTEKIKKYLNLI